MAPDRPPAPQISFAGCKSFVMLNIKKILLPVDFPNTSLSVIHQAAMLAHHFHSEIVMLHVMTAQSHLAGVPEGGPDLAGWDLLLEITKRAEKSVRESLRSELDGLSIQRVLAGGGAGRAIVQLAQEEKADLIMMPSHGPTFDHFLLSSVAAQGSWEAECPVWTDAHVEVSPTREFVIRNVLCAVDFNSDDRKTASWAAQMTAEFGARLTLAHVTAGVEYWGPGGSYVNQRWKEELFSDARQHVLELQQEMGTKADVFIGSGDVPTVLNEAVKHTKANLLVAGCHPYGGHLRTRGYPIIRAVPIPVLNV